MAENDVTIEKALKAAGVFKRGAISYDGDAGIEIETETIKPYREPELKYWRCVPDGSLRDFGREYVLNGPMKSVEIKEALEEIRACNKKFKFEKDRISTSVHVHLNMQRENWLTLANFVVAYLMVENVLIKFSGPDRLSNLFCLPACDAEGVVTNLDYMLNGIAKFNFRAVVQDENRVKYGALNCAPLSKFGSIEIRSFRGETDVDVIYEWVQILLELKNFSKTRGLTPPRILQIFNDDNHGFLSVVFPEFHRTLTKNLSAKQVLDLVTGPDSKNLYYAAKLAQISKDWNTFGVPKPKKLTTAIYRKTLDDISTKLFGAGNPMEFNNLDFGQRVVVQEHFHRLNPNMIIAADIREDI